jgi:hypothetical protein
MSVDVIWDRNWGMWGVREGHRIARVSREVLWLRSMYQVSFARADTLQLREMPRRVDQHTIILPLKPFDERQCKVLQRRA